MDIKLTEIVRATTLTLKVNDAPMTALPIIKDAFAKLATDLDMLFEPAKYEPVSVAPEPRGSWMGVDLSTKPDETAAATYSEGVLSGVIVVSAEVQEEARQFVQKVEASVAAQKEAASEVIEAAQKRRGRPPKAKTETAPETEDKESQGEPTSAEAVDTPSQTTESATAAEPTSECEPVTDRDLQTYCVKVAQHYGGAAKVYDLCKPFVEEGAVARPSNIKGDGKRWAFIKAVEADSGVKYHG